MAPRKSTTSPTNLILKAIRIRKKRAKIMVKHIHTENIKYENCFECSGKDVVALNFTPVAFATKTMWMGAFERQLFYRFVYCVDCRIPFDIFFPIWHKRFNTMEFSHNSSSFGTDSTYFKRRMKILSIELGTKYSSIFLGIGMFERAHSTHAHTHTKIQFRRNVTSK